PQRSRCPAPPGCSAPPWPASASSAAAASTDLPDPPTPPAPPGVHKRHGTEKRSSPLTFAGGSHSPPIEKNTVPPQEKETPSPPRRRGPRCRRGKSPAPRGACMAREGSFSSLVLVFRTTPPIVMHSPPRAVPVPSLSAPPPRSLDPGLRRGDCSFPYGSMELLSERSWSSPPRGVNPA